MKTGVGERFDREEGKGEVAAGRTRVHLAGGGGLVYMCTCVYMCALAGMKLQAGGPKVNAQHIHTQGKSKSLGHCQEHPVKGIKK